MTKGFFCEDDTQIIRGDEIIKKHVKKEIHATCETCGRSKKCSSPKMPMGGVGNKKILLIGEAPSENDDATGEYFSGAAGSELRELITNLNFDADDDFWMMNAVSCFSYDKNTPTALQLAACNKRIKKVVDGMKPTVIIPFGKAALDSLIAHKMIGRISGASMTDWVGCAIPDQDYKCYICPTWDIHFLLQEDGFKNTSNIYKKQITEHIEHAIRLSNSAFYESNYNGDCFSITDVNDAIKILKNIKKNAKLIALDYETTGLKPHRKGHKIFTASISDGMHAWAFPYFNDEKFRNAWLDIMKDPTIFKIMHNGKFENAWTKVRGGFNDEKGNWIKNMTWDTMLGAHGEHNKKKTNLKFHVYVNLGIAAYDDSIDAYLQPTKKEEKLYGANAFNQIEKAPLCDLLHYNALDSLFTFKLYEKQMTTLSEHQKNGIQFFTDSIPALAKMEYNGILLDTKQIEKQKTMLSDKMNSLEDKIRKAPELKKWNKPDSFSPSNPNHLSHLLFNILKKECKDADKTATGKPKADIEAMNKFNSIEIVKNTLEWRKLQKILNTYLAGFTREEVNSLVHTFLNLDRVDTFRSSSDAPNLQNIPARDAMAMNILRKLIIARPGNKLGEYDYKAMEAVIIAVYNQDPNWIRYVSDVNNDMHRDMAAKIVIKKKVDVSKDERQIAKNKFVFPTVYGSWYKNTAANMWGAFNKETKAHLKEEGIKKYLDFVDHIQSVEQWFWNDQFPIAYEWMKKTILDYEKKGYIDLYTGFRCYGPMSRNQIINYRVQGTASHCKLWTIKQVSGALERKKMKSRLLLEIHDSIIPDIVPEEENELDYQMWLWGTQKIREYWDWLTVPLFIEKKISDLNGNWAEMHTIGLLNGEKNA